MTSFLLIIAMILVGQLILYGWTGFLVMAGAISLVGTVVAFGGVTAIGLATASTDSLEMAKWVIGPIVAIALIAFAVWAGATAGND